MATDGKLICLNGSSRNGKTAMTKHLIKQHVRVLAWDVEGEFAEIPGFKIIRTRNELLKTLQGNKRGKGKYAYQGGLKDYDFFCLCALAWGDSAPCAVVLEEISDVTNPGKAPNGHGQLIRKGLKRGIYIYAITQRPAESDKTAFGNATEIICFFLNWPSDQKYMAEVLGVNQSDIDSLQKLEYIKKDNLNRKLTRGKLQFS